MRDRIKRVAEELLVKHGYPGLNFRLIAEVLKTTRANLHYHFGNKEGLVEEVLDDYANLVTSVFRDVLTDPKTTLLEKSRAITDYARQRYVHYNPDGDHGHPWSLLTRLRSDIETLNDATQNRLQLVGTEFEILVRTAVKSAVQSGELRSDTNQEAVVIQILTVMLYQGLVTRDSGTFDRLVALWDATIASIIGAYGHGAPRRRP